MREQHLRPFAALLALVALVATFLSLPASADEGDVVANPGDFEITVVGGALVIKDDGVNDPAIDVDLTPSELPQCSDGINNDDGEGDPSTWLAPFDQLIDYPADPECSSPEDNSEIGAGFQEKIDTTFSGSVDWDGNITVAKEDIVFPKSYLPGPFGLVVEATIGAAGPATGTLDPVSGAVTLAASLQVQVAIPAAANTCLLGPLNVQLTTGTTAPPTPNGPITGVPYANDGTLTLVNNSFGVPALTFSPTCGLFGVINDALGLPSPAGMNTAIFAGQMDTVFVAPGAPNEAPVADAGEDQTVASEAAVVLDGSGSSDPDEDELTFSWVQTGGDATVELDDATSATPGFTAPVGPDELTFELTVSDGELTDTDTVTVTVEEPVAPPNEAPVADAGEDQTVASEAAVVLDGSGSSDPDEDELTFSWVQTGGDATVELDDATSATPGFTAPVGPDELTFELTVSDGELTDTDTVTVTVEAPPLPGVGAVAGVATDAIDTEPVAGARVRLYTESSSALLAQTFTDLGGAYSFGGLETGGYKVRVDAAGYLTQFFDGKGSFHTADVVTVAADATSPADVALVPSATLGAVSGTVTGGGTALPGAIVRIYNSGGQILASALTGADGGYIISKLPPGAHKVLVIDTSGDNLSPHWIGGSSLASASTVSVVAGSITGGIDADLVARAGLGTVRGTVTEGGSPAPGLRVVLYDTNARVVGGALTAGDGSYTFADLAPGTYFVRVRELDTRADAWWDGANRWRAADPIAIGPGSDITGIDIAVTALALPG